MQREVISLGHGSEVLQVLMHERDGHAAFADGGGDALDRARSNVTASEDARHARLEQIRIAVARSIRGRRNVDAGEHVAASVARDLAGQPLGLRIRADEDEETAARPALLVTAAAIGYVDRGEMAVAVDTGHLGAREHV